MSQYEKNSQIISQKAKHVFLHISVLCSLMNRLGYIDTHMLIVKHQETKTQDVFLHNETCKYLHILNRSIRTKRTIKVK